MARGSNESVLTRAVRILEVFTPEDPSLPVGEIAQRASLHVATTSRLVAELTGHGLLARQPDGRVRIGVRLWELAFRASPALSLREAAMPYLEDLHAIVGHHVQLGVLDGEQVLFLERLSSPGAVVNYTRIAGRLPLHVSSSGVVLLAHADRALQERVLAGPLVRYTDATITSPDRLRALLADVRHRGSVQLDGHVHEEATGIAVPVRDAGGGVVAALSAIVPNDGQAHTRIPVLLAAARGVRRALSSPPPPWSLIG